MWLFLGRQNKELIPARLILVEQVFTEVTSGAWVSASLESLPTSLPLHILSSIPQGHEQLGQEGEVTQARVL